MKTKAAEQHTPGPWRVSDEGTQAFAIVGKRTAVTGSEYERSIAWVARSAYGKADAALVAASPDMLAVLETIVAPDPDDVPVRDWLRDEMIAWILKTQDAARAAIARAKGEKS